MTPQALNEQGNFVAAASTGKPTRWRARAKVRDTDGRVRDVERFGATKSAAERELKLALQARTSPSAAGATLTSDSTVAQAALQWLTEVATSDRSTNTKRVYNLTVGKHVVGPASHVAHLALRELKVSIIESFLLTISREHGPGAAKMTRSVLSGILDFAVKHDAVPVNLVRSLPRTNVRAHRRESTKDTARAFTRADREVILKYARTDERSMERDLGDLVTFLAGTGARLGEALGLRWSHVDLVEKTATLGPTVVRETGRGLHIQEAGKTRTSQRVVRLPEWLVGRLLSRQVAAEANEWDVVFVSPLGRLRDPSNTSHHIRELLDGCGYGWASAHTFRKSVATWLDEAGVSGREVANQLGHAKPSMTLDVYMDRRSITEAAALL